MTEHHGPCAFCGEPVTGKPTREVAHAWEPGRLAGGGNAVQGPDRRYTGRVAHPVCHASALRLENSGLVGQESLL